MGGELRKVSPLHLRFTIYRSERPSSLNRPPRHPYNRNKHEGRQHLRPKRTVGRRARAELRLDRL